MAAVGAVSAMLMQISPNRLPVLTARGVPEHHVYVVFWAVESASFCFRLLRALLSYKKYIYTNNNNTFAILFSLKMLPTIFLLCTFDFTFEFCILSFVSLFLFGFLLIYERFFCFIFFLTKMLMISFRALNVNAKSQT